MKMNQASGKGFLSLMPHKTPRVRWSEPVPMSHYSGSGSDRRGVNMRFVIYELYESCTLIGCCQEIMHIKHISVQVLADRRMSQTLQLLLLLFPSVILHRKINGP
jgi:hypothetical protein